MGADVGTEMVSGNMQPKRASRWRRLPEKLGPWWWWMWPAMQLSGLPYVGRYFTWLAGLPVGPYRAKWVLARIKPYVSPKAQIGCPNMRISQGCFIDDFVTIASGSRGGSVVLSEGVGIYRGTIIEVNRGAKVVIGKDTHIQANCIINGLLGGVEIGRNVMIAPHCGFFPYQHEIDDLGQPLCKGELVSKGDIIVEDDVWLGMGVTIMDGVRIGRGAVIGAGAVVSQCIPPYSVATGVPARVVRKRGTKVLQDAARQQ